MCSFRVRVGSKIGLQWTLTYSYWTFFNSSIPSINVAITPGLPQAADASITAAVQDIQQASTPLTGWFTLGFGEYCDTVQVTVGESPEAVQAKVENLPGVPSVVDVTMYGNIHEGLTYTVSLAAAGPQSDSASTLKVVDSDITGSEPSISTYVMQKGSSDLFYGPIPADMLRVPVLTNKGIQLEVNGVPSACGVTLEGTAGLLPGSSIAGNASAACSFEASASATPALFSVVPNGTIAPGTNVMVSVLVGRIRTCVHKCCCLPWPLLVQATHHSLIAADFCSNLLSLSSSLP
jgi:hypothetical protein